MHCSMQNMRWYENRIDQIFMYTKTKWNKKENQNKTKWENENVRRHFVIVQFGLQMPPIKRLNRIMSCSHTNCAYVFRWDWKQEMRSKSAICKKMWITIELVVFFVRCVYSNNVWQRFRMIPFIWAFLLYFENCVLKLA